MLATHGSQSSARLTFGSLIHESTTGTPTSILIIDAEKAAQNSLIGWFLRNRCEIGTAENANEALRQLQAQRWDIILVDIDMPGLDDMELQQQVRDVDSLASIILTAESVPADKAVGTLPKGNSAALQNLSIRTTLCVSSET